MTRPALLAAAVLIAGCAHGPLAPRSAASPISTTGRQSVAGTTSTSFWPNVSYTVGAVI